MNFLRRLTYFFCFSFLFLNKSFVFAQTDSSVITFYRPLSMVGSGVPTFIICDNQTIKLFNGTSYQLKTSPGKKSIKLKGENKERISIDVLAGKSYHVIYTIEAGLFIAKENLFIADSAQVPVLTYGSKLKPLSSPHLIIIRPERRFGVSLNLIAGIENIDFFKLDNGDISSFSFGGGTGISCWYGQQFGKNADLSITYSFQANRLSPMPKDAIMKANRHIISITPSWILNIQDGDFARLYFGAGIDYCFPFEYEYDFFIPGDPTNYKSTYNYKESLGFHATASYLTFFGKKFSLLTEITYQQMKSQYLTSNNFFIPIGRELTNPVLSGLLFRFGVNYHF